MKTIQRQSIQNRLIHWGVAFSTFGLIFSGILQMPISKRYMLDTLPLMGWSGDYSISLVVHYIFAFALCFFVFFHILFHSLKKEFDIFPKKGDFKKSILVIKAMIFKTKEPPSEKYLPEQRLAYFAISATLLLLIITGLIKTYKNLAGFNLSKETIFWVAQLHNFGMFLIIFLIIFHLLAFAFKENRPLLKSMFSGKVDANYIAQRHSLWKAKEITKPKEAK
ncbi:cytochrome b/b6 domain-containing protein [Helicobacter burdigaliensis]|uniref:cytochrome b/b6 domain-containing protein n=1 Tax=Helicobacter burdigaliensis TaxID=2315334 RepID=UPI000EF6B279|nr:cytochrome b/b6 domain-containing protein [Helicobacter burdigaliensis]